MKDLQQLGKVALCVFTSACAIQAAPTNVTAQATVLQPGTQGVVASASSVVNLRNFFQGNGVTHRPEDKNFARHHSPFACPPGPTMPLGATRNPARTSAPGNRLTIRFLAASRPLVYDLPPGAKIRFGAAPQ